MVINTNVEAQRTASHLMVSQNALAKSLARLSSGSKIINPSDDAAGLAVSARLESQVRRLDSVLNNLGNAMSLTQTQDGYIQSIDSAFTRMSELAMMAQDNTKQASDRALYNEEFQQLMAYVRDSKDKDFNGVPLFDGSSVDITIDADGNTFTIGGVDLGASVYSAALQQQTWKVGSNPIYQTSKAGYVVNTDIWELDTTAHKLTNDMYYDKDAGVGSKWSTSGDPADKILAGTFVRVDAASTAAAGAGAVAEAPPSENAITYAPGTNDLTTIDLTTQGNGGFTTSHYTTHEAGSFLESEPVGQGDLESQHRKAVSKGYFVAISPIATGEDAAATEILAGSTISTLQDLGSPNGLGVATSEGGVDLNTVDGAKTALTKIVDALSQLHLDRAGLGAIQSRIEFTNGQLTTSKQNLSQAKSRITDVDVASESTEYARQQILVQSGTQMLREANRLPQTALELLR
jgi:flagellin